MRIRLIVADMDDTLLRSDGAISGRTLDALNRAKQRGARVCLASGRMTEAMLFAAQAVQVNAPILSYNGGATYDVESGRVLRQTMIPAETARELCAMAEGYGLHVQGYDASGYFFAEDNEQSRAYEKGTGVAGHAVHGALSEKIHTDQFKILIIADAGRVAELLPLFCARFDGRVNCVNSKAYYIECIAPGIDKGAAVKALARDLGVAQGEILAFGDGQNDLEMLNYAGLGYAMGNASDAVKARAPRVCASNDEDGMAQIIEQLLEEGAIC